MTKSFGRKMHPNVNVKSKKSFSQTQCLHKYSAYFCDFKLLIHYIHQNGSINLKVCLNNFLVDENLRGYKNKTEILAACVKRIKSFSF